MLFKSTFLLGLAALAVADSSSDRMVKIKRAQDGLAADAAMAKRAAPSPAENLARRSGATRMDKRHHGDAAAHADMVKRALAGDYGQVDKRDLPLFQGLLSLLNQVYPGLNTAVFGVEHAANGAVNGLDGILKRNNIELSENQKRELPLFQGLLSTLNQLYPGLNTAVFGVESAANGAVNGLDGILKRDATAAPVNEKRELPLFPGLLSLLNQLYPGLNTAVYGVESAANGAVNGLDGILKKRELPLFPGLLSLLNQVYPGLNTAVFGTEVTLNGAVNGLDGILKKRDNGEELNEVEKRELPLFQGLLSLLNQVYPGLNTAVFGVEHAANGAVNGLDGILKRDTATVKAKVDLAPVVANLLGGSTTITDLSGTQLSQLRGLAALLNVNQFNSYLGTALSATQFGTLQSLLGVTVNRLLGGLLSGALLSPSSGLPIGGLLGGATGGNLLGGLLGGLGKQ